MIQTHSDLLTDMENSSFPCDLLYLIMDLILIKTLLL